MILTEYSSSLASNTTAGQSCTLCLHLALLFVPNQSLEETSLLLCPIAALISANKTQYRAMRLILAYLTLGLASAVYAKPVANVVPSDYTSSPVQAIVARKPKFPTKVHTQYLFSKPFGKQKKDNVPINNPTANAAVETILRTFGLTDEIEALNDFRDKKLSPNQEIRFLIVLDVELPTTSTSKSPALRCPCKGTVAISTKDGQQVVTGTLTSTRSRKGIGELDVDDETLEALIEEEKLNSKTLVAKFTPPE
ncbi:hypothetical protein F5050DRAFT_1742779 [Lentinula boryana]|uniref:Uncharacterized protein n=1 Tax=Lentinula boryana TaxID=40481 RepID=A0ABQ8QJL5_9AGAR|nr:hypothetical protein F5050DRAFT_1742779 [Lentinula boryana]